VRNAALNTRRNRSKDDPLEAGKLWFHDHNGATEAALSLQSALLELPEEQRETIILRIWSGMTLAEVAIATGVPVNTAASRYRYAIEKLRERLKPWRPKQEQSSDG
jgi:RNA polymerase sigma-70 factor (ECF subfamily)